MTKQLKSANRAEHDAVAVRDAYGPSIILHPLDLSARPSGVNQRNSADPVAARDPVIIGTAADLGALVRAARTAAGLTQQQFADSIGVGRRFLSELENGKPTVELGRALKVCQGAGIIILAQ